MRAFADRFLAEIEAPDGFILKYASPSCGPREVKLYVNETRGAASTKTSGMFGGATAEEFPHCAIEDKGRLKSFDIAASRFRRQQAIFANGSLGST